LIGKGDKEMQKEYIVMDGWCGFAGWRTNDKLCFNRDKWNNGREKIVSGSDTGTEAVKILGGL
jgi:hypothetical protein